MERTWSGSLERDALVRPGGERFFSRGVEAPGFVFSGIADPREDNEATLFALGTDIGIGMGMGIVVASRNAKLGRRYLLGRQGLVPSVCVGRRLLFEDELADEADVVVAISIGEKAVVPNASETRWKDVKKESPEELVGVEAHDAPLIAFGVVLPGEGDVVVVDGDDATVGDGDAVGVSGEVLEDLARAAERGFRINEPVLVA